MTGAPFLTTVPGLSPDPLLAVEVAWGADLTDLTAASWTWSDVTADVLLQGGNGDRKIRINLGSPDEAPGQQTQASQMTCVLDNRSGKYSLGGQAANWPNVRRSTPVRVRMSLDNGSSWFVKYQGGAVSWQPGWDPAGRFATVLLTVSGPLRRFNQGSLTPQSVLRRYIPTDSSVIAYWPCEDDSDAQVLSSTSPNWAPLSAIQYVNRNPAVPAPLHPISTASDSSFACSAPLPQMPTQSGANTANQDFTYIEMPMLTSAVHQVSGLFVGSGQATSMLWWIGNDFFFNLIGPGGSPSGPYTSCVYVYFVGSVNNGALAFQVWTGGSSSTQVYSSGAAISNLGNIPFRWSFGWSVSGGNTTFTLSTLNVGDSTPTVFTHTISGFSFSAATYTHSEIAAYVDSVGSAFTGGGAFGHYCYHSTVSGLAGYGPYLSAHASESPTTRLPRIGTENLIPVTVLTSAVMETSSNSLDAMGPQYYDTLSNLLREVEATGAGVLYDGLGPGLTYVTRLLRESQQPVLTIDASTGGLSKSFDPIDDDQLAINDATVTRRGGATVTYQDLVTDQAINAIGDYQTSITINPTADSDLAYYAQWLVHLGTQPGYRYPSIQFALERQPSKIASWLACFPGARMDITNITSLRTQMPSGTIRNVLEGWTEEIDAFEWHVEANCSNWNAWNVGTMAASTGTTVDTVMRRDTDGSAVNTAAALGATSLSVKLTAAGKPLWTVAADDFPMIVEISGMPCTVTAITGASSPQTFTIPAGLPKAVAVNDPVRLWNAPVLGM